MNSNKHRKLMIRQRKKLKMTQQELANIVGISRNHIANIECGIAIPSLVVAHKISLVLDLKMEVLFMDDLTAV